MKSNNVEMVFTGEEYGTLEFKEKVNDRYTQNQGSRTLYKIQHMYISGAKVDTQK